MKTHFLKLSILLLLCSCGTYKKVVTNSVTGSTDTIYYKIVPGNDLHFKQRAYNKERRKQNLLTKNW